MILGKNPIRVFVVFYMIPFSYRLCRFLISPEAKEAMRATKAIKSNRYIMLVYKVSMARPPYSKSTLLHDKTITLLHHYTITRLHYYTTTRLHYYTTTLLHYYRTELLRCTTAIPHYYTMHNSTAVLVRNNAKQQQPSRARCCATAETTANMSTSVSYDAGTAAGLPQATG